MDLASTEQSLIKRIEHLEQQLDAMKMHSIPLIDKDATASEVREKLNQIIMEINKRAKHG